VEKSSDLSAASQVHMILVVFYACPNNTCVMALYASFT
jgi:hypothetical protein